jgi:hypothetical protein
MTNTVIKILLSCNLIYLAISNFTSNNAIEIFMCSCLYVIVINLLNND